MGIPSGGRSFDVQRFIELGRVAAVAPSPCGRWLAVQVDRLDREGGRFIADLWRVDLAGQQAPHPLTNSEQSDRAPAFRADGALLFLSDRARPGEESPRTQVWCLPALGGEPIPLTDEPLGVDAFQVARDVLVVQTPVWPGIPHEDQREHDDDRRKRGPSALHYRRLPVRFWDHWLPMPGPHLVAYQGDRRTDLTPNADREHRQPQWHLAEGGEAVVITQRRLGELGIDDVDLCVITIENGETRLITGGPRVHLEEPRFSPDGRQIVCVRSALLSPPTYRPRLCLIDLATTTLHPLADDWPLFPHPVGFTPEGAVLVTADEHGRVPVFQIHPDGTHHRLLAHGSHSHIALTPDGHLVGLRSTFSQPPEPFVAPLTPNATPKILSNLTGFDPNEVPVIIEEFTTVGAGGTPVQSFLLRPAHTEGPLPLLLWIHGGPMGHHADGWHWRWNPLLATAAGYAVALPNPRGSTGFGQSFVDEIWDNRTGAECFQDILAVTDTLATRSELDPERFVAMGGSFGGYMANLIGTRSDRFAALISHAGIYHYPMFRSTTDEPAWFAYGFGFEPDSDPDAFTRHSPHRFVAGWRTPTLILHGDKDFRVPVTEALALFEALQRHHVPSELVIFPDENHWIQKPRNVVAWYQAWLDFLQRHL